MAFALMAQVLFIGGVSAVFASSPDSVSDTMTRQKLSVASGHTLVFDLSSAEDFAATDTLVYTFTDDPGTGAWTFPVDGFITSGVTFDDGASVTVAASCTGDEVTVEVAQTAKTVTVTACASYVSSSTDAVLTLVVPASVAITNPEVAGQYEINAVKGTETSQIEVPILADDQVSVTASVDTYINFGVATATGSDNAIDLGELAFSAVTSTAAGDNIVLTLDTNATGGTVVQVASANGGLASTVANYTLTSASETLAANQDSVSDTAGYGLQAQSVSPTSGTMTESSPYNGSSTAVGAVGTSFATIYTSPVDAGLVGASANVYVLAVPAKDTPAADDYTDTLTFRATGTF